MSAILSKTYIDLEVKQPLFVIDFYETGIWKTDFPSNSKKISNFMTIRPEGAEWFNADRRTDRET